LEPTSALIATGSLVAHIGAAWLKWRFKHDRTCKNKTKQRDTSKCQGDKFPGGSGCEDAFLIKSITTP
jgi:hypothetical protein